MGGGSYGSGERGKERTPAGAVQIKPDNGRVGISTVRGVLLREANEATRRFGTLAKRPGIFRAYGRRGEYRKVYGSTIN